MIRAVALAATLLGGCYWSTTAPRVPYGQPEIAWPAVPASAPLGPPPEGMASSRLVVVARFRALVQNPVGGLYDHRVENEGPLWRTYYTRDVQVPIFEGFTDRLREAGVRAWKDYTDGGNVALLEPPLRRQNPLVVTAALAELRHDQLREPSGATFEAALATFDVTLLDLAGKPLWRGRRQVVVKAPAGGRNFLHLVGAILADDVARQEAFRRALRGAAS